MKKFISMVMAAAMVVSLVPATAFAASASFKVPEVQEMKEEYAKENKGLTSQVQIGLADVDQVAGTKDSFEITLDFDNAELPDIKAGKTFSATQIFVARNQENGNSVIVGDVKVKDQVFAEDTSITLVVTEKYGVTVGDAKVNYDFKAGDALIINLSALGATLTKTSEGTEATVEVTGDFGATDEPLVVTAILGQSLDITVAGKPEEIAEEGEKTLKTITIESKVGNFDDEDVIKVKVDKDFEFGYADVKVKGATWALDENGVAEKNESEFKLTGATGNTITITGLVLEAVKATAGEEAVLKVTCTDYEADEDVAAVVIGETVTMSVDEDEDVPVMYSGVNAEDTGLDVDGSNNHVALEVTIEESVAGAWDNKAFDLKLPEGVHVVGFNSLTWDNYEGDKIAAFADAFTKAYEDGDYENFEFGRRVFKETETDTMELKFKMILVAEPGFVGPVVLTLEGEAVDTQEVTIAEFVAPYTVEAAQNDMIIDYRNTEVPTAIVIKEAEAGLWEDGETLTLSVEKMDIEDEPEFDVNVESEMEIDTELNSDDELVIKVKEKSEDEPAVITITGLELYMGRALAAGAYDLNVSASFENEGYADETCDLKAEENTMLEMYEDLGVTAKEGFVNIITAGRDQDDASFTKTVIVPVGATEIVAGEETVALDVPAYINAAGYTMLPVRAVAVALGIHNNNVIWDQATKTVTILYGQRIITMAVGSKVINVNGSAIPASAAVEIVNGRTFLGLRDLATALGVTDITWDAATQTATLNGNK